MYIIFTVILTTYLLNIYNYISALFTIFTVRFKATIALCLQLTLDYMYTTFRTVVIINFSQIYIIFTLNLHLIYNYISATFLLSLQQQLQLHGHYIPSYIQTIYMYTTFRTIFTLKYSQLYIMSALYSHYDYSTFTDIFTQEVQLLYISYKIYLNYIFTYIILYYNYIF